MKHDTTLARLILVVLSFAFVPKAVAITTLYVDDVNGHDSGNCTSPTTACKTIGHAVSLASAGDSINVAAGTYTENLQIGINLKLVGSKVGPTAVDGGGAGTVVAVTNSKAHVVISNFLITNGAASSGGGISNFGTLTLAYCIVTNNVANGSTANGAGIANYGKLTINNSSVSGNKAKGHNGSSGGGIASTEGVLTINRSVISGNSTTVISGGGGIIINGGTLTINRSTISQNSSAVGGGIFAHGGTVTVSNTTFSANTALNGGGINNEGLLMLNNSTFSGNKAVDEPGGAINNSGTVVISNTTFSDNSAVSGGGIYNNGGAATIQNSIVANSSSGGNCGGVVVSNGYNLSSDGTCNFKKSGDLNNTGPDLGPLKNNGGPTQTQALLPGSPAIDAGNPSGCVDGQGHLLKTDQRGKPRPDKEDTGGCDMGAYETQN